MRFSNEFRSLLRFVKGYQYKKLTNEKYFCYKDKTNQKASVSRVSEMLAPTEPSIASSTTRFILFFVMQRAMTNRIRTTMPNAKRDQPAETDTNAANKTPVTKIPSIRHVPKMQWSDKFVAEVLRKSIKLFVLRWACGTCDVLLPVFFDLEASTCLCNIYMYGCYQW